MPNYSLNWTPKSSAIQKWQRCQCCSSLTRRWPSWSRGLFGLKSAGHRLLFNVGTHPPKGGLAEAGGLSASSLQRHGHLELGERKVKEGRGSLDPSRNSSAAGLCWSSAHLVQCGLDEFSWSWTQIRVQARMTDYSLNWTARSSAIRGWQRCQCCSSPTRRWASRSRGPFGLKSAMEHWLFGADARHSTEKPLHEAATDDASSLGGSVSESKNEFIIV